MKELGIKQTKKQTKSKQTTTTTTKTTKCFRVSVNCEYLTNKKEKQTTGKQKLTTWALVGMLWKVVFAMHEIHVSTSCI